MKNLEFKEKSEMRKIIENYCYSKRYDENLKWKKETLDIYRISKLLKGSLDIEKKQKVEKLLEEKPYLYKSSADLYRARSYCIGKAIIILYKENNSIIQFIPLDNFEVGIIEYSMFIENKGGSYKAKIEIEEKFELLKNEFRDLGDWELIEKGSILNKIDIILSNNKELGEKSKVWEDIGIDSDKKSQLCKRYNLFKKFEKSEIFSGEKNFKKAIEKMTINTIKVITKENISDEERENMLLEEILKMKG